MAILEYYSLAMLKKRHHSDTFLATGQVFQAEATGGV
jgi:hypothetical protein